MIAIEKIVTLDVALMIKVFSSLPWQQVLYLRVFTETGRLADILSQLYICEILLRGGGGEGGSEKEKF